MKQAGNTGGALLVAWSIASAVLIASAQVRDAANVVTTGTAQISGSVLTDDALPAPVRRATMTLTGDRSGVQLVAVTDDDGQFTFTSLLADRYTVSAAKGGYLPWRYGSKRPGGSGTPIVVSEGQRVAIVMTVIRGSVLTGTIRDEQGATAIEYGLIAAGISIAIVVVVFSVGSSLNATFTTVDTKLSGAAT